ncbi:MAG: YitT family protein [Halanaerobiales bacterium]|nr:YitT family protein [Halanaerobiales bacterium]
MKKVFWDYVGIAVGCIITAIGLVIFLVPNKIASGGASGLATVTYHVFGIPVGIMMLFINIPLFLAAVKTLGRQVGARTLWAILVLSLSTDLLTTCLPVLTYNPLLASIYGGATTGFGMGLVFRSRGTTGGTDLVAALVSYYFPTFSIGQGLFLVDVFVVVLAGIVFNAELALYATISIFIASKVIDLVQQGFNFSKAAFIISDKSEEILDEILEKMGRGVTTLDGKGGYTGNEKKIMMVIISRAEVTRLKNIIYQIDPDSFVFLTDVHDVLGEGFKEFSFDKINEAMHV